MSDDLHDLGSAVWEVVDYAGMSIKVEPVECAGCKLSVRDENGVGYTVRCDFDTLGEKIWSIAKTIAVARDEE